MSRTGANSAAPTKRQLAYLKALAARAGQSFTWPTTRSIASREIRRLESVPPAFVDPSDIDIQAEQAAREANSDAPIQSFEVSGFGSTASWSRRS